ncbi:hypothetical protein DSO57_1001909 [Entomophthora muscae]|uniref:Uncharacterized protein n=1 Tax=Entomophthora muscae TaxID=34485 RepID=A0ACC2UJR5_9FUNG|nr:hypothetical protein DSO57_1001909 [Entomophthora muscae]
MEVTNANFATTLPIVEAALKNCIFYAIDLEMSGIVLPNNKIFSTDTLEDRYLKNKKTAQAYLPLQFGLCTFEKGAAEEAVVARTFSFIIYPDPNGPVEARTFSCQSNTLSFLSRHQFNFYKWIRNGIPFSRLNASIAEPGKHYVKFDLAMDDSNAEFMTVLREKLHLFFTDATTVALKISTSSPLERRLVYQETNKICGDKVIISSIHKGLKVQKKEGIAAADIKGDGQVDRNSFSALMNLLIACKKPIVGHNCYMDFCFTLHHLANGLPPTLSEFKKDLLSMFPIIIDTKHIVSFHPEFKAMKFNSALEKLLTTFEAAPTSYPFSLILDDGELIAKSEQDQSFHNAGYDALCTGKVLLYILARLQNADNTSQGSQHFLNLDLIKAHHNKLFNMMSELDSVNLEGSDGEPAAKVEKFLISGFSQSLSTNDIYDLFKNISVQVNRVYYVDESRSWVEFSPPAAVRLCANPTQNEEQRVAYFSGVPTGSVSDLLKKGLLNQPSAKVSALLAGATITPWKEWYKSTIPARSSNPSDDDISEAESSEASTEDDASHVTNPDELDLGDVIEECVSSNTAELPSETIVEVADNTREKKSRSFDSTESLPAAKKSRTESNL